MTEDFLDFVQVQAVLNQTGCVGVTQGMRCASSDSSPIEGFFKRQTDIVSGQPPFVIEDELV